MPCASCQFVLDTIQTWTLFGCYTVCIYATFPCIYTLHVDEPSTSPCLIFSQAKQTRQNGSEDPKDLETDLGLLHSQLLSNRAAAALSRKNFRQCKQDCQLALAQCNTNMKAHYRLCKATHMLRDYETCLEACAAALKIEPTHQDVLGIQMQCEIDQRAQQQQALRTVSARFEELRKTYIHSFTVAKRLGITLGWVTPTPEPLQLRDRWPCKAQDGSVTWPTCMLYPQYGTLDVVPDAQADALLGEYLAHIFPSKDEEHYIPPPWDLQAEYDVCDLVAYLPLHSAPAVRSVEDWVQTCLEHYALHQAGSMDVVKHAYDQLRLTAKQEGSSDLFSSAETFVSKIANQVTKRMNDMSAAEASGERKRSGAGGAGVGYLEVHMGCSIQNILTSGQGAHVLPRGVLTLYVYVRGNAAHQQFLDSVAKENKKIEMLQPV
ncbi:hypothetical protein EON64_07025 [archaeon]|nr:MAG: hypothetical protein EON64_07025 [archaeon]